MRPTPSAPHALRRLLVLTTTAFAALGLSGVAQAAIVSVTNTPAGATQVANTIATASTSVVAANFDLAPPLGTPNGYATAPINVFPTDGPDFGILTSGNVQFADDPNTSPSTTADDAGPPARGSSAYDITVLRIVLNAPVGSNCLTFDFKFLTEEFPEFVGTQYNDGFIAELDADTWTTVGSNIVAPNNFAFDQSGNVISVNTAGMSAGNAAGTTYDGATTLLSASTTVTPGSHSLFLSILDQGDRFYDSAVFLDNLRVGFVPNPAVNCKPGAQPVNFKLSLSPSSATNPVGSPHTVTATLTDSSGNPVSGATIQFTVTGANAGNPGTGPGVTDLNGKATFTYTGTNVGDDTISACYDADGDGACEATASATKHWVAGPPAKVVVSPLTATNTVGEQHCVTATVTDAFGNPNAGVTVYFNVGPSVPTTFPSPSSGSAKTDANGVTGQFCYTASLPGTDTIRACADRNGNGTIDPGEPCGEATKIWKPPVSTQLCEAKITEGGWIVANNGDRANFGGNAKNDGTGLSGQEEFQDQGPAQPMNVHSYKITAITCSDDRTQASIYGEASIDGAGMHVFKIDVTDVGEGGSNDTYGITLDTGYMSGQHLLMGGNVQIH
jgi:hypothetical protein